MRRADSPRSGGRVRRVSGGGGGVNGDSLAGALPSPSATRGPAAMADTRRSSSNYRHGGGSVGNSSHHSRVPSSGHAVPAAMSAQQQQQKKKKPLLRPPNQVQLRCVPMDDAHPFCAARVPCGRGPRGRGSRWARLCGMGWGCGSASALAVPTQQSIGLLCVCVCVFVSVLCGLSCTCAFPRASAQQPGEVRGGAADAEVDGPQRGLERSQVCVRSVALSVSVSVSVSQPLLPSPGQQTMTDADAAANAGRVRRSKRSNCLSTVVVWGVWASA
jgi:hypothetical protein